MASRSGFPVATQTWCHELSFSLYSKEKLSDVTLTRPGAQRIEDFDCSGMGFQTLTCVVVPYWGVLLTGLELPCRTDRDPLTSHPECHGVAEGGIVRIRRRKDPTSAAACMLRASCQGHESWRDESGELGDVFDECRRECFTVTERSLADGHGNKSGLWPLSR